MPFDERQWNRLLNDIRNKLVVPVIGPELLAINDQGKDTTLRRYLAGELARKLEIQGVAPGADLHDVLCQFFRAPASDVEDAYYAIDEIIAAGAWPVPEPLKKLAQITDFDLYLSTTFDTLVEQALNQSGRRTQALAYSKRKEVADIPDDFGTKTATIVYQIYGRIDATHDYVLTEEDLLELTHRLQNRDRRPQNLFDVLRARQLLVLGCGMPGWLSRFFLRAVKGEEMITVGARGYVADELARADTSLVAFLERRKSVIYSEGGAVDFVNELHRRWVEKNAAAQPVKAAAAAGAGGAAAAPVVVEMPTFKPDAVFISYASEDRALAREIKTALETAGVDVWYDERALEPGDDYREKILSNIEHCSFFLPLVSRNTTGDDRRFFRLEWRKAVDESQFRPEEYPFIQPVVVDDTTPDAPNIPREFKARHWNRLDGGKLPDEFIKITIDRIRQRRREQRAAA